MSSSETGGSPCHTYKANFINRVFPYKKATNKRIAHTKLYLLGLSSPKKKRRLSRETLETADHVKLDRAKNVYSLLRCASVEEADAVMKDLQHACEGFSRYRKINDRYIAFEERGNSLRCHLRSEINRQKFISGPTLLEYRNVLIDMMVQYEFLKNTRLECELSLKSVFVEERGRLCATFTSFRPRDPGIAVVEKDYWSRFATFVEEINQACLYQSTHPPMDDFLRCLRDEPTWPRNHICGLPLFWDSSTKFKFWCDFAEMWETVHTLTDGYMLAVPPNWRHELSAGDLKLKALIKTIFAQAPSAIITAPRALPASKSSAGSKFAKFVRNELGHFAQKRLPPVDPNLPKSRAELMCSVEKVFPGAISSMNHIVLVNRVIHSILPGPEKKLTMIK